jgi:hypothetical protein
VICSSAIGFDPRVHGIRLTFGFEGIWQGTAVLYDHQSSSLWMHITGTCFEGAYEGTVLKPLPSGRHTTWEDWRRLHPATEVLAEDPAHAGGTGPHAYFTNEGSRSGQPFFPPTFPATIEVRDPRLPLHALLHGIVVGGQARAYPFEALGRRSVVNETIAGIPVTVWFDARSRSAAAFEARHDGRTLAFVRDSQGRVQDRETKSTWSMEGRATAGPLAGTQLVRVRGLMSEWYGWRASYPETTIFGK